MFQFTYVITVGSLLCSICIEECLVHQFVYVLFFVFNCQTFYTDPCHVPKHSTKDSMLLHSLVCCYTQCIHVLLLYTEEDGSC